MPEARKSDTGEIIIPERNSPNVQDRPFAREPVRSGERQIAECNRLDQRAVRSEKGDVGRAVVATGKPEAEFGLIARKQQRDGTLADGVEDRKAT